MIATMRHQDVGEMLTCLYRRVAEHRSGCILQLLTR